MPQWFSTGGTTTLKKLGRGALTLKNLRTTDLDWGAQPLAPSIVTFALQISPQICEESHGLQPCVQNWVCGIVILAGWGQHGAQSGLQTGPAFSFSLQSQNHEHYWFRLTSNLNLSFLILFKPTYVFFLCLSGKPFLYSFDNTGFFALCTVHGASVVCTGFSAQGQSTAHLPDCLCEWHAKPGAGASTCCMWCMELVQNFWTRS